MGNSVKFNNLIRFTTPYARLNTTLRFFQNPLLTLKDVVYTYRGSPAYEFTSAGIFLLHNEVSARMVGSVVIGIPLSDRIMNATRPMLIIPEYMQNGIIFSKEKKRILWQYECTKCSAILDFQSHIGVTVRT